MPPRYPTHWILAVRSARFSIGRPRCAGRSRSAVPDRQRAAYGRSGWRTPRQTCRSPARQLSLQAATVGRILPDKPCSIRRLAKSRSTAWRGDSATPAAVDQKWGGAVSVAGVLPTIGKDDFRFTASAGTAIGRYLDGFFPDGVVGRDGQ